jgi:hypothetical protein
MMFKIFLRSGGYLLVILMVLLSGCALFSKPIPAADLNQPGWTVREGQAVWRFPQKKLDIAGEIVVATRPEGHAVVQFTKAPFPFVLAQIAQSRWDVEFPPQKKHYSGRGTPPKRIIWLYLPLVLEGKPPPENWTWQQDGAHWRLENHVNEESLEGYFNQ